MENATGMLAWLEVGDGVVSDRPIRARAPRHLQLGRRRRRPALVNVYVDNVDAHYARRPRAPAS
jgi:hypothetical protein